MKRTLLFLVYFYIVSLYPMCGPLSIRKLAPSIVAMQRVVYMSNEAYQKARIAALKKREQKLAFKAYSEFCVATGISGLGVLIAGTSAGRGDLFGSYAAGLSSSALSSLHFYEYVALKEEKKRIKNQRQELEKEI